LFAVHEGLQPKARVMCVPPGARRRTSESVQREELTLRGLVSPLRSRRRGASGYAKRRHVGSSHSQCNSLAGGTTRESRCLLCHPVVARFRATQELRVSSVIPWSRGFRLCQKTRRVVPLALQWPAGWPLPEKAGVSSVILLSRGFALHSRRRPASKTVPRYAKKHSFVRPHAAPALTPARCRSCKRPYLQRRRSPTPSRVPKARELLASCSSCSHSLQALASNWHPPTTASSGPRNPCRNREKVPLSQGVGGGRSCDSVGWPWVPCCSPKGRGYRTS